MEQFDDIHARQALERDALERKEAEALVSQEETAASATAEPRNGLSSDILLLAGVVVLLVCLLALNFKPAPSAAPAAGTAIAQQQAPPPVGNATFITWDNNLDAAVDRARTLNKRVMIDFYTDWCGVCKKVDSEVYTNPQVISEAQNFVTVKINAERYTVLAGKYDVHRYPTFLFLDGNGNELGRHTGGPDTSEMLRMMQQYRPA